MFCTASLPRKWSMRKTWSSSTTSLSAASSSREDSRSRPNGFSTTRRARSVSRSRPSMAIMSFIARRRHREVDEPAHALAQLVLGVVDGLRRARSPLSASDGLEADPLEERRRPRRRRGRRRSRRGPRGRWSRNSVVAAGGVPPAADDRVLLGQPAGRGEAVEAREELAGREVPGGPEEDEDVRREVGRHAFPVPANGNRLRSTCGRKTGADPPCATTTGRAGDVDGGSRSTHLHSGGWHTRVDLGK